MIYICTLGKGSNILSGRTDTRLAQASLDFAKFFAKYGFFLAARNARNMAPFRGAPRQFTATEARFGEMARYRERSPILPKQRPRGLHPRFADGPPQQDEARERVATAVRIKERMGQEESAEGKGKTHFSARLFKSDFPHLRTWRILYEKMAKYSTFLAQD